MPLRRIRSVSRWLLLGCRSADPERQTLHIEVPIADKLACRLIWYWCKSMTGRVGGSPQLSSLGVAYSEHRAAYCLSCATPRLGRHTINTGNILYWRLPKGVFMCDTQYCIDMGSCTVQFMNCCAAISQCGFLCDNRYTLAYKDTKLLTQRKQ